MNEDKLKAEIDISETNISDRVNKGEIREENSIKLRYILLFSILSGLFLNFLQTYIRITMGFLGMGVGSLLAILLLAKIVLKKKESDTKKNFTIIAIAFGATQAAEASIGFLFLIWLSLNASIYNLDFNPPSWLLPSSSVINSRILFSTEWITPIFVHLFLMLIPGLIGLAIGWMIKDYFLNNEKEYPFPGVIQTNTTIEVLTSKNSDKWLLFRKWAIIGFLLALITMPFFAFDISSPNNGYIIGLTLGPIGVSLFSVGYIINKQSATLTIGLASIFSYTLLSVFLIGPQDISYFEFFNYGLQNIYFSIAIGILMGGLIAGPVVAGLVKGIFSKNKKGDSELKNTVESKIIGFDNGQVKTKLENRHFVFTFIVGNKWSIALIFFVYMISLLFLMNFNIFESTELMLVILILFWIIIVGGFVNGYLMINGSAKTGAVATPPFLFDELPIFLSGVQSYLPYVATPRSESDGTIGIVRSAKLATLNKLDEKLGLVSYLLGYFSSSLTTPFFAILLFVSFGIGTEQFPAPAFPVQGALLAAFAQRNVEAFLSFVQLFLGLLTGIAIAFIGPNVALGVSLGFFFPPHMALCLTVGGLTRLLYTKRVGDEISKKNANTIGTGLAVGGSFVVPIMILVALLG
jgi:hypothetical protein